MNGIPTGLVVQIRCLGALADKYDTRLWLLMALSGIFGLAGGLATATWQHPIETAQVLMGLVVYDHSSLPYAYHVSTFSFLNYVSWGLLFITNSEMVSSILLSGLLGVLAMQTLAMSAFVIIRNVYLATLIALLLGKFDLLVQGISYPVIFLGTEHAYGRAGLFFALYAVLFIALSRHRIGFLLCGLSLGVHPTWGLWVSACLVLALIVGLKRSRVLLTRTNASLYLAGVGVTVLAFIWQRHNYPLAFRETAIDVSAAREILLGYIRFWDYHRQKFADPKTLIAGLLHAGVSAYVSLNAVCRKREAQSGEALFCSFVLISAVLGGVFVFIPSWFDPGMFPESVVVAMPGRFINLSIVLCTPFLVGYVYKNLDATADRRVIIAFFVLIGVAGLKSWQLGLAVVVGLSVSYGLRQLVIAKRLQLALYNLYSINLWMAAAVLCMAGLIPFFLLKTSQVINNRFWRIAIDSQYSGAILTTMERYMVQVETRRSSLVPHIDRYVYVRNPSALVSLNRYTQDVFGISFTAVPPLGLTLHSSMFLTQDFQKLWEDRRCDTWEELAKRYQFGLILVPSSVRLRLPRADNDARWDKYIPTCDGAPSL